MKAKVPDVTVPAVGERRVVHILNPSSGGKKAQKYFETARRAVEKIGGDMLVSEKPRHIMTLAAELFAKDPYAHAVVYGGDGTVYETVNGIMLSGNASTACFSVIPQGSGNDFSKYANDLSGYPKSKEVPLDIIKTECGGNVRYFANMMNIGFDCEVVRETYKIKKVPFLQGSLAYIVGVISTLAKKSPLHAKITMGGCVSLKGNMPLRDETAEKKILLTACANSKFCGGGFDAAPLASLDDGLMDVLIVNNVSIPKFASLVGAYHDGTYIDENGTMSENFSKVLSYHRSKTFSIDGAKFFCLDGEVFPTNGETLKAEVLPAATNFIAL